MGVLAAFALVVGGLAAKLYRWETVQADAPWLSARARISAESRTRPERRDATRPC
jgi:hypothetical protein